MQRILKQLCLWTHGQMDQTIRNTLQVLSTLHPPAGIQDARQLVDPVIANAVYAT